MSLHLMFDAAYPPGKPYPGAQAVAGYIGGNALNVWTIDEWHRFSELVQYPIWVGYQENDPKENGEVCATRMHELGWSPSPPSGNRRAVLLDFEGEVNPAWVDAFATVMWGSGYETIVYGEASTIGNNPPKEGRWIALWNGQFNIPPMVDAVGHQFKADAPWDGTQVDLSAIDDVMMAHGGLGARKG